MSLPKLYLCNFIYLKHLLNSVKLYRLISATLLIAIGHQKKKKILISQPLPDMTWSWCNSNSMRISKCWQLNFWGELYTCKHSYVVVLSCRWVLGEFGYHVCLFIYHLFGCGFGIFFTFVPLFLVHTLSHKLMLMHVSLCFDYLL